MIFDADFDEWCEVARVQGLTEAHIIRGLLESNRIPVKLMHESAAVLFGITMNGIGEVRILVPLPFKESASSLIHQVPRCAPPCEGEESEP